MLDQQVGDERLNGFALRVPHMRDHAVLYLIAQRRWMQGAHLPASQPGQGVMRREIPQVSPGQHPVGDRLHVVRCG